MGIFDLLRKKNNPIKYYGTTNDNGFETSNTTLDNLTETRWDSFKFIVDDVFYIIDKGVVVTGKIQSGRVSVGDRVIIKRKNNDEDLAVTVIGIEKFRRIMDTAEVGQNVGIILSTNDRSVVTQGDELCGEN